MAILHSCCFWRSVRTGSYASSIYTLMYFGTSCIIFSIFLHEERLYLSGETEKPSGESFLEKEKVSSTSVVFNIILLICASCGVISSILVIVGLKTDQRELLLPWILIMIADILVEIAHFIYLIILETLDFEPLTATLFTIDFFIMCLNVYCVLCILSQYQEYKVGRGGLRIEIPSHIGNVQYNPPPSINSNLNKKKHNKSTTTSTNGLLCPHTNCTLTIDETQLNGVQKSRFQRKNSGLMKKHVQFPDELKCCTETSVIDDHNGNGPIIKIDLIPEYSEDILSWQEQSKDKEENNG